MPTNLIEFRSNDGPIVVEIEQGLTGPLPAASPGEVAGKAKDSFSEAVAGIKPIAEAVIGQLRELGPTETTVEFGIKFSAKAGVILASAATEGQCKITLSWTKPGS